MTRKITLSQLRKAHACMPQVSLFKETFGEEVEVSAELALKYASKFDFSWAAGHLLSRKGREAYDAAKAPIREAYDAATAPIREAYNAARASAREAYNAALALAFFRAYESDVE